MRTHNTFVTIKFCTRLGYTKRLADKACLLGKMTAPAG
jgi:hypothetical protein